MTFTILQSFLGLFGLSWPVFGPSVAIGADRWLLGGGYRLFSRWWWRDIFSLKIPKRYIKHKYQRLTRGYSNADMWDASSYLADIISATAYWHFAHNQGIPFDYVNRYGGQADEEWRSTLLDLYEGFRNDEDDVDWRPSDAAFDLLRELWSDLWD